MAETTFKDAITNAIRFWERGRILYNIILAAIVLSYFFIGWPISKEHLSFDLILSLFILAVLANVAYCAAYIVDILVQLSAIRDIWVQYRWILLAIGILFAAILTRFISRGFFLSIS
ncbi:MAG: hypothetical protein ACE14V_16250 [bacterium]